MANRLAEATSPYLLQHKDNPVDWYEWGEEALDRARREERPILLSVGYAACHWCHVMERESFEDEEIARLMNESFVCVKVDREERPDIDAIYMDAVQAMTGHGGWPMTVFLSPDGRPFYAGTYFPPEDRHGMPGFKRVLAAVAQAWRDEREKVLEQGRRVVEAIAGPGAASSQDLPSEQTLSDAARLMRRSFDDDHGGFGGAPKFPQPMSLEFLLRMDLRGDEGALEMVRTTLDHMAAGGIRDHVGGGFHRYSTDERWLVPHFEKMLYDNALLARLYLHAWQLTGDGFYREVATDTLDYVLRDLRHEGGAFFSSQDADSEGVEGRYYVWEWDELVSLVGEEAARRYGASPEGNWGGESGDEAVNVLIDRWAGAADELTSAQERTAEEARLETARIRRTLADARSRRVPPATDDKVLAAWNGLAIQALAETGAATGESKYVDAAAEAARFVLSELRREGRLHRAWREGRTSGPGFADDLACMAAACLALYEATFEPLWFDEARALTDDLLERFGDREGGGFFQTADDAEELVIRPKELFDNAVPAAGSVAAELLLRLSLYTGEARYEEAAHGTLRAVAGFLLRAPSMFGQALCALDLAHADAREVAVVGPKREALLEVVREGFRPHLVTAAADDGDGSIALLAGKTPADGAAAAYVCRRFVCERPVTEPRELVAALSSDR